MAWKNLVMAAVVLAAGVAKASDLCMDNRPYEPIEQRYTRGLLFKIEKCGEPASYIFGTVHLARLEVTRTGQNAFNALEHVQALALELGESEQEIKALGADAMLYPRSAPPHSLEKSIGKARLARLHTLLKGTKFTPPMLEQFRPWAIAVVLELVGEDEGSPLDEKIKYAALLMRKRVFGLEKPQDQIQVFVNMPEKLQLRMLDEAIDHSASFRRLKEEMLAAYTAQDLRKISSIEDETMSDDGDGELDDYLQARLIDDRNRTMVPHLEPHLRKESVLVAIGAMHLMGESGVLRLLEQDGYRITPMP